MHDQQIKQQGELLQQHKKLLKEHEMRLHDQELQVQQQDQRLDQQDQQLLEHEQQLDQQDQFFEENKLILDDLLSRKSEEPKRRILEDRGSLNTFCSESLNAQSYPSLNQEHGIIGKKVTVLWEKIVELCDETRYLDAYKQVIAEPDEFLLLNLMQRTGPICESLDAESNSRLIRRLIHILSSTLKEQVLIYMQLIFAWLRQALTVGIHFTSSQVEDLCAALQKVSSANSALPPSEKTDAAQLFARICALRRI